MPTDHAALTAMLDAARALHERDESDPQYCATCGDVNTYKGHWPCATATALGATGRSEWAVTAPSPATRGPLRCDWTNGHGRCILNHGHRLGEHIPHPDTAPLVPPCTDGKFDHPCVMQDSHWGPHTTIDGDQYGTCGMGRSDHQQISYCISDAGHDGDHHDQDGQNW